MSRRAWQFSIRTLDARLLNFRACRTPTMSITIRGEKEFMFPVAKDTSACFSRRMRITTSFLRKFLQLLARAQRDILEKGTKASTDSFWECRHAPIMGPRSGFTPFRTETQ